MSNTIKKFYNIFNQSRSCRNLFLLSKEQLLETFTFGPEDNPFVYSTNRIIVSNAQDSTDIIDTIKFRNEDYDIDLGNSIDEKIEYFKPIIEDFFDKRFKKSVEKLTNDIEKKGWKLIIKIINLITNDEKREKNTIKLLKDYNFIGKHLNTFKEVENYFESMFVPKKVNDLINEKNLITFFEGIKFIKEIYVNHSYKRLYSTNQVLTNILHSEDNFESRLKLFHHLYESKIIANSKEDAFIECSYCEPGTYKGVFQLKLNPKKLEDLKCPVCSNGLTYFVPYQLHHDIYNIVKQKDGLLLDALAYKLSERSIKFKLNINFLNDIEVDCIFENEGNTYIVEVKMFKISKEKNKIESKIKEYFGKLTSKVERLSELDEFREKTIVPLYLLNIPDKELLTKVNNELKRDNKDYISQVTKIINWDLLKFNAN